jgi:succinate-acetate transporter protein
VQQAWFIFTFILLLCTLKSTVAFFLLFFTLDLAFLMLGIGHLQLTDGAPNSTLIHAGGGFGLLAAFLAWYNALAGIADTSNRYVAPDACSSLPCRSTQRCSHLGQDCTMVECSLTVLLL